MACSSELQHFLQTESSASGRSGSSQEPQVIDSKQKITYPGRAAAWKFLKAPTYKVNWSKVSSGLWSCLQSAVWRTLLGSPHPCCGGLFGDTATFELSLLLGSNPSAILPVTNPNENPIGSPNQTLVPSLLRSVVCVPVSRCVCCTSSEKVYHTTDAYAFMSVYA